MNTRTEWDYGVGSGARYIALKEFIQVDRGGLIYMPGDPTHHYVVQLYEKESPTNHSYVNQQVSFTGRPIFPAPKGWWIV